MKAFITKTLFKQSFLKCSVLKKKPFFSVKANTVSNPRPFKGIHVYPHYLFEFQVGYLMQVL